MKFYLFLVTCLSAVTLRAQCVIETTFTRDTGSKVFSIDDAGLPYLIELKDNGEYNSTYVYPANGGAPETRYTYTGQFHVKRNKIVLERISFRSGESIGKIVFLFDPDKCVLTLKGNQNIQLKK